MKRADDLSQRHRRFGALVAWCRTPRWAGSRQEEPVFRQLTIEPIGVVETPFQEPEGAPIQPSRASGARGRVRVAKRLWDGLKDLAGFERIWLIYWLHRRAGVSLRVTPFLDRQERGVFATRAPARPVPIGISAVRLLGIEEGVLEVADVDMIDGTPLLDIKPYIPEFDSYPASGAGWFGESDSQSRLADDRFGMTARMDS